MRIYHKTIKLSIAAISVASLMLNFLFPHIALANDIGRNGVLSFDFSETTNIPSFILEENSVSLAKIAGADSEKKKNNITFMLPIEPSIEKENNKVKKIIVSTLAKRATEEVIAISEEDQDKIAENICAKAGIEDLPCHQDLKAIREIESTGGAYMTGDRGLSIGWYQIQTELHNVTIECAMDFKCSTEWTVGNLIKNGYDDGYKNSRYYAIMAHNGVVKGSVYAKKIMSLSKSY